MSVVWGCTRVVDLLQLKRVNNAEREPDVLGLHLFTVKPMRLNGLVHVVVVRHHGTSRDQRSGRWSLLQRRWRWLHMCGRRLIGRKNIKS